MRKKIDERQEHISLKTLFHEIQEHALAWYKKKKPLSHSGFCYRIGLPLENTKMMPLAGNTPDDFQILN